MINLLSSGFLVMLMLSGCGWNGAPTRNNDFTPLTSITISADYPTIALHTSAKLKVTGNFSGLFTRDVTDQVARSSNTPTIAAFSSTVIPPLQRSASRKEIWFSSPHRTSPYWPTA